MTSPIAKTACGCTDKTVIQTPWPLQNRPGLDAIAYRIGTQPAFFEALIARLTSHELDDGTRPLQRLTARNRDDFSIALLDAWAVMADVLTFYQERIANEGFLMTATERRSVLELARLVGYRLRPGVAASTYLAFTLDDGFEIELPEGVLARSLPGPDEMAEPFETAEPLFARTAWNAIPARLYRPQTLRPDVGFDEERKLYLDGIATNLATGHMILLRQGDAAQPYVVRTVTADSEAGQTTVCYADPKQPARLESSNDSETDFEAKPVGHLASLGPVVRDLRQDPSMPPQSRLDLSRGRALPYRREADLAPQMLAAFQPQIRKTLFDAYANAPADAGPPEASIQAMRVNTGVYGANAPEEIILTNGQISERREWPLAEIRTSLVATLRSFGTPIDTQLGTPFNLDAGARPQISVEITAQDRMRSETATVQLADLPEIAVVGADANVRSFQANLMPDVNARVSIRYREIDAGWLPETIQVEHLSPSSVRPVMIFGSTASEFAATGALGVTLSGFQTQTLTAGAAVNLDPTQDRRTATLVFDSTRTELIVQQDEPHFAGTRSATRIIALDGTFDRITPGTFVIIDRPGRDCRAHLVQDARAIARTDYGIAQRVTHLLLDGPWISEADTRLSAVRGTTVHAVAEDLPLSGAPIETDVKGDEIELDGLYEGLEAGRWITVSGERTDVKTASGAAVPGIEATELAMIAGTRHGLSETVVSIDRQTGREFTAPIAGDTLHTILTLAEPLAYCYRRNSVAVNANVARATHGETVAETLGSASPATKFQTFSLGRPPLTHLSAATPTGTETTLELRINDIRWPEVETLLTLGPDDRGYQTKTDDDGVTHTVFGSGKHGVLPPAGAENVTALYRSGIGLGGNVNAGQITSLSPRPLGVKEVTNPIQATGGADAESRDQARERVPLAVRALDRLVSVEDYTDFTRLFAGIGKAQATQISDGSQQVVHVTIAGAEDAAIERNSDLYRNLGQALTDHGDPSLTVRIARRQAMFLFLNMGVKVHPDYLWEKVEPQLRTSLLSALGFEARALGEPALLGTAIAAAQAIEGVDYVDVDLFDQIAETDAETPETLADRLTAFVRSPVARSRLDTLLARTASGGIQPAQISYLNPDLPDTLILTEIAS